jgi:hypothetical protein
MELESNQPLYTQEQDADPNLFFEHNDFTIQDEFRSVISIYHDTNPLLPILPEVNELSYITWGAGPSKIQSLERFLEIGPDQELDQEYLEQYGSVIRALESVAGQPASINEHKQRIKQIIRTTQFIKTYIDIVTYDGSNDWLEPSTAKNRFLNRHLIILDIEQIKSLIDQLQSDSHSVLGRALEPFETEFKMLSDLEIRQLLNTAQVLIADSQHLTHVAKKCGRLISLSDPDNPEVELNTNTFYPCLVFTKKAQE